MKLLLSILLVLLLVPSWSGEERLPLLGREARVTVRPVALFPLDRDRRRLGALTYLGGVELASPDPAFGSISAMAAERDRLILLSDAGNVTFLRLDSRLRPVETRFANLPAGPGTGWHKRRRDSESLTRDPATGRLWVGFEQANAIWRFTPDLARVEAWSAPPEMAGWGANSGPEAMTRLRDGGMIAIRELGSWKKTRARPAIRFSGDPVEAPSRGFRFGYLPPDGFSPADMAELPDGRLLVLDRGFRAPMPFVARLSIVDPRAVRPGATVSGREIARFEPPALAENFEALAVGEEGGRPVIWIASDDNNYPFQRSLLLKFRLE